MSSFRDLANSAKKRLKSGYWQEMYDRRDEAIMRAIEDGESATMVSINMRKELKSNLNSDRLAYENEGRYRKIIEDILDSETIVYNPIGRMIDKEKFDNMTIADRERYVLVLSKIYLDLRGKILSERRLI